jgi:ribosomal protein S18 acetylase RimI-like enzyme
MNIIKKLNLKDLETVRNILELQIASYEIEANIIDFYDIPTLKDTVNSLEECDEIFYGYYINNVLTGIISFKIIEDILDIHRVVVDPIFFRKGIAEKLVSFVEEEHNVVKIVVSTGKDNLPAVSLYLKMGYAKKQDIQIDKDVYLTELEKVL